MASAPVALDPIEKLRRNAALFCHKRDVGAEELTIASLLFSATGAFVLLAEHPGFGAALGLLGLFFAALSTVRPVWDVKDSDLPKTFTPLCDYLLLAGALGGLAVHHSAMAVGIAMGVVALVCWLPSLESRRTGPQATTGALLWSRREHMVVLLLGSLLGRPGPALAAVLVVGGLEAWFSISPPRVVLSRGNALTQRLFLADGRLNSLVRWVSLGVVLASLFLFPVSALWRV